MFEYTSNGGRMRFMPKGYGLYEINLQGKPGASGAAIKALVNGSFGWMFVNTDAYVLLGLIAEDNKRCLIMCPHFIGRLVRKPIWCEFKVTLAHWAKAYGIEKALSEMRAAGQSEKADKLEAAAKKAGVLS